MPSPPPSGPASSAEPARSTQLPISCAVGSAPTPQPMDSCVDLEERLLVVLVVEEGVVHAVGVAPGVLPGHVVVRVRVEGRLVHAGTAGVEQMAQVGPQ